MTLLSQFLLMMSLLYALFSGSCSFADHSCDIKIIFEVHANRLFESNFVVQGWKYNGMLSESKAKPIKLFHKK